MIRVYLDTSIVRFADSKRTSMVGKLEKFRWGPGIVEQVIYRPHTEHPLEKLNNERDAVAYADAQLIPKVEALAKEKLITLCWHLETAIEYGNSRTIGGARAPTILDHIEIANCPIYYGRVLVSPFDNEDKQFEFIRALKHPAYEKWKKLVGAMPDTKNERNQLMDAWHLWSAEHNHCDYFLTMDYRLIKSVASRKHDSTLRLTAPTQFLDEFKILRPAVELELQARREIVANKA